MKGSNFPEIICKYCGDQIPEERAIVNKTYKTGYANFCKDCRNVLEREKNTTKEVREYRKKYREENRDKIKEYDRNYTKKNKQRSEYLKSYYASTEYKEKQRIRYHLNKIETVTMIVPKVLRDNFTQMIKNYLDSLENKI